MRSRSVGPVVAVTLMAELPELGRVDRRRIAADAGLARITRDSGRRHDSRTIGGGRPVVRTMLYIAALHASRRCSIFQEFRRREFNAGKPVKAAITATARKLVSVLNAMLVTGADYSPGLPVLRAQYQRKMWMLGCRIYSSVSEQ